MSPPWMPLYIADYRLDTARLSAAEHGAYLLLIMEYWATGSLPDDDRQLARIACMSDKEWKAARPMIAGFFQPGWRHKRIDGELKKAAETIVKRRAAAEEMHSRRRAKADARAGANAGANAGAEQDSGHLIRASNLPPREDTEANASGAEAPPAEVRYIDAKDKLRRQGVVDLRALGVKENGIHSLIGRWLKLARDDADVVSAAIDRAIALRIHNPIPWITSAVVKEPARTGPSQRKSAAMVSAEAGMRILNESARYEPSQPDFDYGPSSADPRYGGPGGPILEQDRDDRWEAEGGYFERARAVS